MEPADPLRIAVLGLGEAGSIYAADLARQGASVTACDVVATAVPPGVNSAKDIREAVHGAGLVLSLVGGQASGAALDEALPAMEPTGIFADMNTSGPAHKQLLGKHAEENGILFADVAILAPVPRARSRTPLVLSGKGSSELLRIFSQLGIPASSVGDKAGVAAELKLLRSVFMKGLSATVLEAVTAARAIGAEEWVVSQIASELGPDGHVLVARILEGMPAHALRREDEMRQARSLLESLDVPHPMTDGAIKCLQALSQSNPT